VHSDGWGASAVDALSTAVVMGNRGIVNQIVDYIPKINFTKSPAGVNTISLFETTIRYLGGLLAGYDLLSGPASNLVSDKSKVEAILTQAKRLADTLKYAFDTPSGIPYNNLNINTKGNDGSKTNGLATIGTLMLEWTRLSDLTNDNEYAQLSQKAESYLLNPQPAWAQPFPGLVGTNVAIDTGLFQDDYVSWCGGDDSFYEYLIKFWIYDQSRFSEYRDRWVSAAESTIAKLTSHPTTRPDLTFVSIYNNGTYQDDSQHLTGFIGGNFLLAGSVLGRQDLIDYGLKLTAAWHDTYATTATHIGPEQFSWNPSAVPSDQAAFFQKNGFYITSSNYVLRPEVMESYYYAYRITGNHTVRRHCFLKSCDRSADPE
jgi:mannosyl-oligosaccharide alpha-1,2-mannosidase